MRVAIVSDVFPPEPLTSAATARDIAEELTRRGHEVAVFAPFPNRPAGTLPPGQRRAWRREETREGYRVVHSLHTLSRRASSASRAAENLSFGLSSSLQLLREPAPDVVYMNTWPIFAQGLNAALLAKRGIPTICVVHDLYPETLFEERRGFLADLASRALRVLDRRVYPHCALVTALNETQAEYLARDRGIPREKIRIFHDWVDASRFPIRPNREGAFRRSYGFSAVGPPPFLAMYVGSMTRMAGLELYLEAARHLRHRDDIQILLVGDGAMREEIERQIEGESLANVRLIPTLSPDRVPATQAAADVLLLSLRPGAALHTTPSKLIFYMLSQRAVLASVASESPAARILRDAACGYVIRQGDGKELAQRLETLAAERGTLDAMGIRARRYAEEHFLKENVLPRVCDMIESVGGQRS